MDMIDLEKGESIGEYLDVHMVLKMTFDSLNQSFQIRIWIRNKNSKFWVTEEFCVPKERYQVPKNSKISEFHCVWIQTWIKG